MSSPLRQAGTYLLFTFGFSSIFYFLIIHAGQLGAGGGTYLVGIMWCPALAAFATIKLNRRRVSELGWKWPATKYALASWYVPLIYASVAYGFVWATGLGGFPNHQFTSALATHMGEHVSPAVSTLLYVLLTGSFGLVLTTARALGEEIGWRGFLVPELSKRFGLTGTALISGIAWSLWHFPLLIFADYNAGTATWYALTCFTVMVVAMSFFLAWLRLKSGSLWTGALLHASHNLYIQAIFTPLTSNTGKTAWFIDEFGAVLPIVAVAFAIYFWTRRREVERSSRPTDASAAAIGLAS